MAINAYEKFVEVIEKSVRNSIKSSRIIEDEIELSEILKMVDKMGFSLDLIKEYYQLSRIMAHEIIYDNDLIMLSSIITYKEEGTNGKERTIKQTSIFSSYDEEPLINITMKQEKKSWLQYLVTTNPSDDIFKEKDIVVQDVSISLKGINCKANFKSYKSLKDNSLLVEKCRQLNSFEDFENHEIEIIYNKDKAIYAEFSNKDNIGMINFNSNSILTAEDVVDMINEEVDTICSVIKTNIKRASNNKNAKQKNKEY